MNIIIGMLALLMIITGIVMKNLPPSQATLWESMGLASMPAVIIAGGSILLLIFFTNLIAICAHFKRCRWIKSMLGTLYSVLGISVILVAVVKGDTRHIDYESPESLTACGNLTEYSRAFLTAWALKVDYVNANYTHCTSAKEIWEGNYFFDFDRVNENAISD